MQTIDAIKSLPAKEGTINLVAASSAISPYTLSCMHEIEFPFVAEGYVGGRFHEGGEFLDDIETLAATNTKRVFGDADVIVQAWRCTNAIVATCFALANTGDTILGLSCASGGYYATGSPGAHFLSKCFNIATYDVDPTTHRIDYESLEHRVRELKPKILFVGDTSYSRYWDWSAAEHIARVNGCALVADISQYAGLIAAGLYPSPFMHADVVLFATYKTLRGPKGAVIATRNDQITRQLRKSLRAGSENLNS